MEINITVEIVAAIIAACAALFWVIKIVVTIELRKEMTGIRKTLSDIKESLSRGDERLKSYGERLDKLEEALGNLLHGKK